MLRALCSSRQRPRHGPTFGLIAILLAWLLHNDGSGTIDSQRRQNVVYIAGASIAGTNYAQIALGSSRHVMSRLDATRHVRRVELVASCLCLHGGRQRSSIELNCASLIFCALDLHQSQEQLLEKVRWTCPLQSTLWRRHRTRVVRVAPVTWRVKWNLCFNSLCVCGTLQNNMSFYREFLEMRNLFYFSFTER